MAEALGCPLAEPGCMLAICSGSIWPIMSMACFIISGLAWVSMLVSLKTGKLVTCFSPRS